MGEYFQELCSEANSIRNKLDEIYTHMADYVLGGELWELESEGETLVQYLSHQVIRVLEFVHVALPYCHNTPRRPGGANSSHQGRICIFLLSSLYETSVKSLMKVRFNYFALYVY